MNWSEFFQAIDSGRVPPVCLFTGPEAYVKREALERLRQKLLPPGLEALNEATLEGVTAQEITDAAETMPMMCERRIVTVRDWAPLLPAKSKNEDAELERMQAWLENPPASCALVFYMRAEPDGRKKMTALFRKKTEVVSFDLLNEAELARWAAARLKPQGKKISRQALSQLTFMAGSELTRLSGELDKLAAYVGEGKEIGPEDVKAIVSASLEYNTYELMNFLLAGDMSKAQQLVNSLAQGGQNPVGILAMLTRQARQLTHMKCVLEEGGTVQQAQEQLKMHPFAARQTARQCAKLSAPWLTALYEKCVEADYAVKSGRMRDRDALDAVFFQIGLAQKRN